MRTLYREFLQQVDAETLFRNTEAIYRCEFGQTFSNYHAAADKTLEILKATGIPNAEKITCPADGKTAYQDKISPLGWEASTGKLTILSGWDIEENFVAADYRRHPFHLIKGSVGTAPEGEVVRILSYEQLLGGEDGHDALVLTPPGNQLRFDCISTMLDLGVRGIVCDSAMNAGEDPDSLQWCNAFTERFSWHVTLDDRPYIAFCVTPRTGAMLRHAAANGEVLAEMQSDARRFESTVDIVTALIPGRRKEEFWITAHLYEPLSNDNSSGVAAAIESARMLMEHGELEFSLRLIFGLEFYGFAAYAALRGMNTAREVIGGCNYDAMYLRKEWRILFRCAGPGSPFYGNYLAKIFADDLRMEKDVPAIHYLNSFEHMYDDDSFLSDSSVGIPIVWPIRNGPCFWHNSHQTMDYIQKEEFARGTALHTAYVSSVIQPQRKMLERLLPVALEQLAAEIPHIVGSAREHMKRRYDILDQDLQDFRQVFADEQITPLRTALKHAYEALTADYPDEIPHSKWRDYAEQIVPERLKSGLPYDLADVPAAQRVPLPGHVLYGPLAAILSNMDGKCNLAEIIRQVEHETRSVIMEKEIRSLIRAVLYLARYGYIKTAAVPELTKEDIVDALRHSGVVRGDLLLVHSALSEFGAIRGGAATVIEAFKEVVGPEGTLLFPAFTCPFVFLGGANRNAMYRPFDPADLKQIWTGSLPRHLLAHVPEAVRSKHISHSWCGIGKLAEAACQDHQPSAPPMGEQSPVAFALRNNGKIVHFGSSVGATTFLHLLEDRLGLPGVETCLVKVKKANGYGECVAIERNLPGTREFYHGTPETIRFFQQAVEQGLKINRTPLGIGQVMSMDLNQLYRIGYQLLSEDPLLLLSRSEKDLSAKRLRHVKGI